ncbi:MAG: hypothetical protein AABX88_01605 [Nanoarchaeota archaeon]
MKSISEESKKILKRMYVAKFNSSSDSSEKFVEFVEKEFDKGVGAESSVSEYNTFENYIGKETHDKSVKLKVSYTPAKHLVLDKFVEKAHELMLTDKNPKPFGIYFHLTR